MTSPPRILAPARWLARGWHRCADRLRDDGDRGDAPRLLCLGDSNTWGYIPGSGFRLRRTERWPGVVAARLGRRVTVIEAGRNGRVVAGGTPDQDGERFLVDWLRGHRPPDFAALMLGSNDCLPPMARQVGAVAAAMGRLADRLLELPGFADRPSRLLLVAPAPLAPVPGLVGEAAVRQSRLLAAAFEALAAERGCRFIDAGRLAAAPLTDGVHLGIDDHRRLGEGVAAWMSACLEDPC